MCNKLCSTQSSNSIYTKLTFPETNFLTSQCLLNYVTIWCLPILQTYEAAIRQYLITPLPCSHGKSHLISSHCTIAKYIGSTGIRSSSSFLPIT
jgi:hypothetical protein